MKYGVIKEEDLQALVTIISTYLDDGWECAGGIATLTVPSGLSTGVYYLQAIILKGDNK